MHFQTFSVVVGSKACNAHCPFCISKQTGLPEPVKDINWRNFHVACKLAEKAGTTTVLITGKGEPTLYPGHVTETLSNLKSHNFPLVEMQTNGMTMASGKINDFTLQAWYDLGLTTIALSVVHWLPEYNSTIYTPYGSHYDLAALISKLHRIGFSVRLCVMLVYGYIDSYEKVENMIAFAKENKVEQLTLRPITSSEVTESTEVTNWTHSHTVGEGLLNTIVTPFKKKATLLQHLMHGMDVYDFDGQNVCLGNCLTMDTNQKDEFRSLIFFPDGSLYWDWQYKGARIL